MNPLLHSRSALPDSFREALLAMVLFGVFMTAVAAAQAQTFTVLHDFTGGADGSTPYGGVTIGGPGILYGTTFYGGTHRDGVVFKLAQRGSGWTLTPLYEFPGGSAGFYPSGAITIGQNGALYGTTQYGGSGNGTGTVFELQPPATACKTAICYWSETVLHSFSGSDGADPFYTILIFDRAGNIYGTTDEGGGANGKGTVFELTPSDGGWSFNLLHTFNGSDGSYPAYGVIFDPAGNLYGTAFAGGFFEGGTVFELSPSGGTWTETVLHDFPLDNVGAPSEPTTLTIDQSGNLYGSTSQGGDFLGTVYELMPSQGSWVFSTLYAFVNGYCAAQPVSMDTAGSFYGTCLASGRFNFGFVFKLTNSGGSWTLTDLYDFTGGSDGGNPFGPVALDANGNIYGTTTAGGNVSGCDCGTVWEVTP